MNSPIAYIYIIHFADAVQQLYGGTTLASIKTMVSMKLKMIKYRKLGSQADTQARRHSRPSEKKRQVQDDEESSESIYIEEDTNSETVHNSSKETQTYGRSPKITKQNKSSKGDNNTNDNTKSRKHNDNSKRCSSRRQASTSCTRLD